MLNISAMTIPENTTIPISKKANTPSLNCWLPRFLYVAAESDDALLVVQYQPDGTPIDGVASNGTGILIEALVY